MGVIRMVDSWCRRHARCHQQHFEPSSVTSRTGSKARREQTSERAAFHVYWLELLSNLFSFCGVGRACWLNFEKYHLPSHDSNEHSFIQASERRDGHVLERGTHFRANTLEGKHLDEDGNRRGHRHSGRLCNLCPICSFSPASHKHVNACDVRIETLHAERLR